MERLAFVEPHFEIAAAESTSAPRRSCPFVFITFATELSTESAAYFFFAEACDD